MRLRQSSLTCGRIAFCLGAVLILAGTTFATTEKIVHSFSVSNDGAEPVASLVADAAGNLYGTTNFGGSNYGTVFQLSPPATAGGEWTETVLYAFQGQPKDGGLPVGTLILDKQGNLFGTTLQGGAGNTGTIFELTPPATPGGAWTETILWAFPSSFDKGVRPVGKLVMDVSGNLYGTTQLGGINRAKCNCGVVFELVKPTTPGRLWSERVLYNFEAAGTSPGPSLLLRGGVVYGTTQQIGTDTFGTVFQLVRQSGLWTKTDLYSFPASEALQPSGEVIADTAGNLYGTTGETLQTCPNGCGTIYELTPPAVAGDPWQKTTLYRFTGHADGDMPSGVLWRDKSGDLFGTAIMGGIKKGGPARLGCGTVFKLKPPAISETVWTFAILHDFRGSPGGDGCYPLGGLTLLNGALYGTTRLGGTGSVPVDGAGTVFSVVP